MRVLFFILGLSLAASHVEAKNLNTETTGWGSIFQEPIDENTDDVNERDNKDKNKELTVLEESLNAPKSKLGGNELAPHIHSLQGEYDQAIRLFAQETKD